MCMIKKFATYFKLIKMRLTEDVKHLKVAHKEPKVWYGDNYGGFYIAPSYINKNSIIYSFGIGTNISFDRQIIDNHGAIVYGFDPTPKSIEWVKKQGLDASFKFFECGLSDKTCKAKFYLPKNSDFVSGSMECQSNVDTANYVEVQMKKLSDIMQELGHTHIDVLKMDIEGSEYNVIENIISEKIVVKQILIEFHDRLFVERREKSKRAVAQLKSYGFEIFGIAPSLEEVSFIRVK